MPVRSLLPNARLPKFVAGATSVVLQLALIAGAGAVLGASAPPEECAPLAVYIIHAPGDLEYGMSSARNDCRRPASIWVQIIWPMKHKQWSKMGPMGPDPQPMQFIAAWTKPDDVEPGSCQPPRYPASAKRRQPEGVIDLLVTVDEGGRVTDATPAYSSGDSRLDAALLSGIKKCRYRQSDKRASVTGRWELRYIFTKGYAGPNW